MSLMTESLFVTHQILKRTNSESDHLGNYPDGLHHLEGHGGN